MKNNFKKWQPSVVFHMVYKKIMVSTNVLYYGLFVTILKLYLFKNTINQEVHNVLIIVPLIRSRYFVFSLILLYLINISNMMTQILTYICNVYN